MKLIPEITSVTMLPIFLVIPTKLISQTKKAAGNTSGGGVLLITVQGHAKNFKSDS